MERLRGTPVRPDATRKITQGCENTNRVLSSGKSGKWRSLRLGNQAVLHKAHGPSHQKSSQDLLSHDSCPCYDHNMDRTRTCVLLLPLIDRGLTGSLLMRFMPESLTLLYSIFGLEQRCDCG